jgi:hypothetical protein
MEGNRRALGYGWEGTLTADDFAEKPKRTPRTRPELTSMAEPTLSNIMAVTALLKEKDDTASGVLAVLEGLAAMEQAAGGTENLKKIITYLAALEEG